MPLIDASLPDDSNRIHTHYIKGGLAASDEIVLSQQAKTRTIFRPAVHGKGVRGFVIRQKIGADGRWKDTNEVDFRSLPPDCGVAIELDTNATQRLYHRLGLLYQVREKGVGFGDQELVVARPEEVIEVSDTNKRTVIQQILDKGYSDDFWDDLAARNPDLARQYAQAQLQADREAVVVEFEESLATHADDEAYWQQFFEANPWILQYVFAAPVFYIDGETYVGGKSSRGRNGSGGVATDFLLGDESTKSFAVVDIKTPGSNLVGSIYRGDRGSGQTNEIYSMHKDLSGGLVQVRTQMSTAVEHFQSVLGASHESLNRVHPKGVLIIGRLDTLEQKERESFNHFRHGLYSLTVITYDEVLRRLKVVLDIDLESGPEPALGARDNTVIEEIDLDEIDF